MSPLVDLDLTDPAHLEELAWLIRARQLTQAASKVERLEQMADRRTVGYYRRYHNAT